MKRALVLAVVFFAMNTDRMLAADDGQTQPRITTGANSSWSTLVDVIPTTNGSGNVKGIQCIGDPALSAVVVFTVNGGATQTVTIDLMIPTDSAATTYYSGWVPFNVRFTTSIRVQMRKGSVQTGSITCTASWALD